LSSQFFGECRVRDYIAYNDLLSVRVRLQPKGCIV